MSLVREPIKQPTTRIDPCKLKIARGLLRAAKRRAKDSGIEFSIELAHIRIPERCPILGLKLHQNEQRGSKWSSPSLDRIDNARGYVPGNVAVVSFRANTLKSNATLRELERLGTWAGKKRKRKVR